MPTPDNKYLIEFSIDISERYPDFQKMDIFSKVKSLKDEYNIKENLVLVGDGKERQDLINFAKALNLDSNIIFPGPTDNPYAWMANAELFILSSDFEGLGMVILESFASGTNVVATNSPGGIEDVMGTGSLKQQLSEMNPENLAEVIHRTLKKPFPKKEINQVLEKFNPDFIIEQFINF